MARRYIDCRETPSVANCTLRIEGEEQEIVDAAVLHAVTVHGHHMTPELIKDIRSGLKNL